MIWNYWTLMALLISMTTYCKETKEALNGNSKVLFTFSISEPIGLFSNWPKTLYCFRTSRQDFQLLVEHIAAKQGRFPKQNPFARFAVLMSFFLKPASSQKVAFWDLQSLWDGKLHIARSEHKRQHWLGTQ
jgi:hypothetical protein